MGRPIFKCWATLHSIRTHISGHGRMELDFTKDNLKVLHKLQEMHLERGTVFCFAIVPVLDGEDMPEIGIMDSEDLGEKTELEIDEAHEPEE